MNFSYCCCTLFFFFFFLGGGGGEGWGWGGGRWGGGGRLIQSDKASHVDKYNELNNLGPFLLAVPGRFLCCISSLFELCGLMCGVCVVLICYSSP